MKRLSLPYNTQQYITNIAKHNGMKAHTLLEFVSVYGHYFQDNEDVPTPTKGKYASITTALTKEEVLGLLPKLWKLPIKPKYKSAKVDSVNYDYLLDVASKLGCNISHVAQYITLLLPLQNKPNPFFDVMYSEQDDSTHNKDNYVRLNFSGGKKWLLHDVYYFDIEQFIGSPLAAEADGSVLADLVKLEIPLAYYEELNNEYKICDFDNYAEFLNDYLGNRDTEPFNEGQGNNQDLPYTIMVNKRDKEDYMEEIEYANESALIKAQREEEIALARKELGLL